ncbi:MAG: hypothetical protein M3530_02290 [Thermoproteota archaeon]|nr:hypothetical protein [Thermoproteota archaeon]
MTTNPYVDIILNMWWSRAKLITIGEVLRSLSDINSLELFKTVALSGGNSTRLARRLDLSRKQYYSKMSRLIKNGLIKKYRGNFCLTIFGITIYEVIEELRIMSDRSSAIKTHSLSQNLVCSLPVNDESETMANRRTRNNNQTINLELITVPLIG